MDELDPLKLDRQIADAATSWRRWRRQLRRGDGLDADPFGTSRRIVSKTMFERVSEMPGFHPLRESLRRWLYRLCEQRINQTVLNAWSAAYRVETHRLEEPERGQFTLAEMLKRALRDQERRRAWLDAYGRRAEPARHHQTLLWERRQELARRMGLASPDVMERACERSHEVAEQWLRDSDKLAAEFKVRSLPPLLARCLGENSAAAWPARTNLRALAGWLNEARLLEGLDLDPGEMPEPIAAASFQRALARIGAAWVDATAPQRQPFVVANDPYGLRRRCFGAMFAMLPLNPDFLRRRLELGSGRVRDERRALGAVVLLESRAAALRLLLRKSALEGTSRYDAVFEQLTETAFGVGLPGRFAGTVFRLHVDDDQRFCGLLLGAHLNAQLIEQHDLDWYRNPRAAEHLRAEADLSPVGHTSLEELTTAMPSLLKQLEECLF